MPEPPAAYQTLAARLADVREKIHAAARRANRAVDQITLIAISKTHPAEAIRAGLELGITDFGVISAELRHGLPAPYPRRIRGYR